MEKRIYIIGTKLQHVLSNKNIMQTQVIEDSQSKYIQKDYHINYFYSKKHVWNIDHRANKKLVATYAVGDDVLRDSRIKNKSL